jgi:hypothetical protein
MRSKPQLIYHQLDEPFFPNPYGENSGISALHDLYPGRPLTTSDGFNRYEIMPEDPEGARRTFQNSKRETQEYASYLVNRSIADGGGNKVLKHAVTDPSLEIEDPDFRDIPTQMMPPSSVRESAYDDGQQSKLNADVINEIVRGTQPAGNARSEGLASSPLVRGTTGNLIEGFESESQSFDPMISNIFLSATIILLIIALVTALKK